MTGRTGAAVLAAALVLGLAPPARAGGFLREMYTNISGWTVADLTNHWSYPDFPGHTNWITDLVEVPVNMADDYGQRLTGYVLPPQSGYYTFWVASDDHSDLYLSTNAWPQTNLARIAYLADWAWPREWEKYGTQQSSPVYLEAGKMYYLKVLMKEGTGWDHLALKWQMPNGVVEAPMAAAHLVPPFGPFSPPLIAWQPTNRTVDEGETAEFFVVVSNMYPVACRWQRDGTNIPGASATNYVILSASPADSNARFRCILTNTLGSVTTAVAVLAVRTDTLPPSLDAVYNLGATNLVVVFSEAVETNSALLASNYALDGGISVLGAQAGWDGATVVLVTSPLVYSNAYTLTVSNVQDLASSPNTMAEEQWVFTAREYAPADIGNPSIPGSLSYGTNGVEVTGGGDGIRGGDDSFFLNYRQVTGDFDVGVRVESLELTDPWAMAGIMARANLLANSDFAAVLATPSIAGVSFLCRRSAGSNLIRNSDFESGNTAWNYPVYWDHWCSAPAVTNGEPNEGGAGKSAPSAAHDGTWMLMLPNDRTTSGNNWHGAGQLFGIAGGESYRYAGWYLIQSNLAAGQTTRLQLEWYDSNTNEVGTRVLGPQLGSQADWTYLAVTGVAPGGATYGKAVISYEDADGRTNSIGEQYNAYWDSMEVVQGSGGSVESFGHYPVNYPYTWLRLRRAGDLFTGFASGDGERWTELYTISNAMPGTLLLGMAVTADDDAQAATARFRDWQNVSGGTTGSFVAADSEPLGPSTRRGGIVVSEIMYHPADRPDERDLEFIELFNTEATDLDLTGFRISGSVDYAFPDHTMIPAGGFLVVANDPEDVEAVYGLSGVLGGYSGRLPNSSGTVRLRNARDAVLQDIEYEDDTPWPAVADGAGHSVVLARPSLGEADPRAWAASRLIGGSPGAMEAVHEDAYAGVVINEFLAHTDPPFGDFIELYNRGAQAVDLAGCVLTDDPDTNRCTLPGGTVIPARGFLAFDTNALGFNLSSYGEAIYFKAPDGSRVIDTARFAGQLRHVSSGRYPDGGPGFFELDAITEGTNNSHTVLRRGDVVINEVMYHPISENDGDEYIELFNRGTGQVDVSGWRITDGVDFTFPTNTVVPAGGYLVVAHDATNLVAKYPQLAATNTVGDFSGQLSDAGERIAIARLDDPADTNGEAWVVVDEVFYREGDDWGRWADGGGSSLELVDPDSDNRLSANWAGSDETAKAGWTTIAYTGRLDNGNGSIDEIHIVALGPGEYLVDDVEVWQSSVNYVTNGTFQAGLAGWVIQGNHIQSCWNTNEGYGGSGRSLQVVATGGGDTGANRIEANLGSTLGAWTYAAIRARVRWLCGHPDVLFRLRANPLEAVGRLDLPDDLGSPGLRNSRAATNAGPAIVEVKHRPVLPAGGEPVVVSAFIHDPDGVASATLTYHADPTGSTNATPLLDDGTGGDETPGDGIYSATLPGQAAGTLVAFHLQATDSNTPPATAFFPEDAPAREGLIRFGESVPYGSFGTYRLWLTQAAFAAWTNRPLLSNEALDGTFVYGQHRVIYNAGTRYRGSPFLRLTYNTPASAPCAYIVEIPKGEKFLGTTKLNLDTLEPWRDNTYQREKLAFWMGGQVGTPFTYQRFVHLYFNGLKRGEVYGDSFHVSSDYIQCWYPDDADGEIFKVDDWFEFTNDQFFINYNIDQVNATLEDFTTVGGAKKQARYRWNWEKKSNRGLNDEYERVFDLVDAMNESDLEDRIARVESLVDVEEWVRVLALRHVTCDWDGYGYARGKNAFVYKAENTPWQMLLWDLDFGLGVADSHDRETSLFHEINDPVISNSFLGTPVFRRAYWQAAEDFANGPMLYANLDPVVDGNHEAFVKNGIPAYAPDDLKEWIAFRRNSILLQLESVDAPFEIGTHGGTDFSTNRNYVTLSGTAPIDVTAVWVNGVEHPVSWTSQTNWSVTVVLRAGTNNLSIQGYDEDGDPVTGSSDSIGVVFTGTDLSPAGHLVLNEIMYHPTNGGIEFVEIRNLSADHAFDLYGWRLEGVDLTFPRSAVVEPGGYLMVAPNAHAFGVAYGATLPVAAEYDGVLDNGGETLRLIRMSGTNEDLVVDEARYDDNPPWPQEADGAGPSLQLIDPLRDNQRAGNWAADTNTPCTPGASNSVARDLPAFPGVRLNELLTDNVTGLTDGYGDHNPWLELFNPYLNVLAVEVHQAGRADPDLWFDLELSATEEAMLIATGAVWRYLDDGSDQGAGWRAVSFNDAAWASGPAQLGYGDGDESTTNSYGPDPDNRHITTYYRHAFNVESGMCCTALGVDLLFDDGAVVYLNDAEVWRTNMPGGSVTCTTLASSAIYGDGETTWVYSAISPGGIQEGTNVVAVEIHQSSTNSSDISFDLALYATFERSCVPTGSAWRYLDDGSDQGPAWRERAFDDSAWSTGAAPLGYGRGDEGTVVSYGAESTNKHVTTHFRKSFNMNEASLEGWANLRVWRDDAVVVYLNGTEILRDNLAAGLVTWTSFAQRVISGAAETVTVETALNPALFVDNATNLAGMYLTDAYTNLARWAFPAAAGVAVGDFLVVWPDGEPGESAGAEYHTDFRLSTTGGCLALVRSNGAAPVVCDYVNYPPVATDRSYGLYPDGVPYTWTFFHYPSPGSNNTAAPAPVPVFINEWMALNDTTISDEFGEYEDWIELYNAGTNAVDLSGYTVTDDLGEPGQYVISNGVSISAKGFLLIWADEDLNQNGGTNAQHADFKLSGDGEEIGLYTPDLTLVDSVVFGPQEDDVSEGRWADGASLPFYTMAIPTPWGPNIVSTNNAPPVLDPIGNKTVDEEHLLSFTVTATDTDTPVQTLTFSLDPGAPSGADINPTNGFFTWTPGEADGPGTNAVTIRVTDNGWTNRSGTEAIFITVNEVNEEPDLDEPCEVHVGPGSLLLLQIAATDEDLPPDTLWFSLDPGYPAGAAICSNGGLFVWEPSDAQAGSTNEITVRVHDDGVPSLDDDGSFIVEVLSLDDAFLLDVQALGASTGFVVRWDAESGETYRVSCRGNILGATVWSNLAGDVTATGAIASKVDTTAAEASQRYYRVHRLLP